MDDVTEAAVFILAAGHGHKNALGTVYHLYIVHRKIAADGYGDKGFKSGIVVNFSDAYICNVHGEAKNLRIIVVKLLFAVKKGNIRGIINV